MRDWFATVPTLRSRRVRMAVGLVACVVCFPATTRAQNARDYLNTPVDQLALTLDFIQSEGQTVSSSGLALPNNYTVGGIVYPFILWSFPLFDKYGGVSIAPSYSSVEVAGPNGTVKGSGFNDPGIAFHANIFGLPALRPDEFASAIPQTFLTVHLTVTPPIGEYDRNAPVNAGSNRWSFTPFINLNITPDKGVQWFELYASGKIFTDNDEYLGSQRLAQDPILTLTGHYSHNIFNNLTWVAIGANYDYGGETRVDGMPQGNKANGWRPSVNISTVIGRLRVGLRYENTSTRPKDHHRNGLIDVRVAMLLF